MEGLDLYPHGDDSLTCVAAGRTTDRGLTFFTGGTDKKIFTWTCGSTASRNQSACKELYRCVTVPATLWHTNGTLLCGTGTKLLSIDIDHPVAKPRSAEFSNLVHQIHVHPANPSVSILEVSLAARASRQQPDTFRRLSILTNKFWFMTVGATITPLQANLVTGVMLAEPPASLAGVHGAVILPGAMLMGVFVSGTIEIQRYLPKHAYRWRINF
jgi:hypothetical protein